MMPPSRTVSGGSSATARSTRSHRSDRSSRSSSMPRISGLVNSFSRFLMCGSMDREVLKEIMSLGVADR